MGLAERLPVVRRFFFNRAVKDDCEYTPQITDEMREEARHWSEILTREAHERQKMAGRPSTFLPKRTYE